MNPEHEFTIHGKCKRCHRDRPALSHGPSHEYVDGVRVEKEAYLDPCVTNEDVMAEGSQYIRSYFEWVNKEIVAANAGMQ